MTHAAPSAPPPTQVSPLRLLERLELILEVLAAIPAGQLTRRSANHALAALGQDILRDVELRALAAFGRNLAVA